MSLGLALLGGTMACSAQPAAPTAAVNRADLTPAERAQRDADKVFQWIRVHADKPVQRTPAAPKAGAAAPQPVSLQPDDDVSAAQPEPLLLASARITTRTLAPLPAAPVIAAPEPELQLPLKLLSRVEPDMPRQLPAHIRSGSVLVRFTVQPDGSVHSPEVLQTTNQRMSAAALDAVVQWRFAPVTQARLATVEVGFSRD